MHEGVELPNGGTLSIIINPYLESGRHSPAMNRLGPILPDMTKKDDRIIRGVFVRENSPPDDSSVQGVNVQLKARAVGLESEDYLNDKVPEDLKEPAAAKSGSRFTNCSASVRKAGSAGRDDARSLFANDSSIALEQASPCRPGTTARTSCSA